MEKGLKCVMMLSLKEMVLRRLAVFLSNDCEIPSPSYSAANWVTWLNTNEDKVKYKISKLLLPKSLRKEMIDKVRPISLEIKKWTEIPGRFLGNSLQVGFAMFYWTTAGTIDYKKTAEALLGCKVLDIEKRYKLASFYCLEDYIPLLWDELAEDRKERFLRRISDFPNQEECWSRILTGKISELDRLWRGSDGNLTSFNQWAFEDSARKCNKLAAEYFFRKLTHDEREVSLMRTSLALLSQFPCLGYSSGLYHDVRCYLLSLMTPEQQMETIKKYPAQVLFCFYTMFWQDLFVENADLIWPSLPTSAYSGLLKKIFIVEFSNPYHLNSFREFFIMSPLDFKKYFVHYEYWKFRTHASRFLGTFFNKEDSESIECIFRNVDDADRVAIVFNFDVLGLFRSNNLQGDKRRMVEVCLREANLSKEDRRRLKRERPHLRKVIEELYESDATADMEKKGQKRKQENCCSEQ